MKLSCWLLIVSTFLVQPLCASEGNQSLSRDSARESKAAAIPIRISLGAKALKPSATLRINEESARLNQAGRDIIRLGFGQSPFPVPEFMVKTLQDHAAEKAYLPVAGLESLRSSIAHYYQERDGVSRTADSVLVGPGAKMLLFSLQLALNGELYLPAPSWVSYEPQAKLLNRSVNYIPTSFTQNWQITPEQLEKLPDPGAGKTLFVILNYPANPAGISYSSAQLQKLAQVARKKRILMVVDEIYAELQFSGERDSLARWYPEGTIIVSGISKWAGAGGWRLGFMVFPEPLKDLRQKMMEIGSETYSSASAPVQYAAEAAYSKHSLADEYLTDSRRVLKAVSGFMVRRLREADLQVAQAEGGFYLFPGFDAYKARLAQNGITTSMQLCSALLREAGVALLPGSDFGMAEDQLYVRMAYVDFDGSEALLAAGKMAKPLDDAFVEKYSPRLVQAVSRIERWLKEL